MLTKGKYLLDTDICIAMDEKRYPILDEEECVGMVSEPAVGYSAKTAVPVVDYKHPDGYDGFYT